MVLPAYAGMIRFVGIFHLYRSGAPRVCGDDPGINPGDADEVACSPRMRG